MLSAGENKHCFPSSSLPRAAVEPGPRGLQGLPLWSSRCLGQPEAQKGGGAPQGRPAEQPSLPASQPSYKGAQASEVL